MYLHISIYVRTARFIKFCILRKYNQYGTLVLCDYRLIVDTVRDRDRSFL